MKILFTFIALCFLVLAASAQLNTDTAQVAKGRVSAYDQRMSRSHDHLHPTFPNIGNPTGPGYEGDGAVFRSEAIINRRITNINDLVR